MKQDKNKKIAKKSEKKIKIERKRKGATLKFYFSHLFLSLTGRFQSFYKTQVKIHIFLWESY